MSGIIPLLPPYYAFMTCTGAFFTCAVLLHRILDAITQMVAVFLPFLSFCFPPPPPFQRFLFCSKEGKFVFPLPGPINPWQQAATWVCRLASGYAPCICLWNTTEADAAVEAGSPGSCPTPALAVLLPCLLPQFVRVRRVTRCKRSESGSGIRPGYELDDSG